MISVGCDISKGYADVAVFNDSEKMIFKEEQIDDTATGERQYLDLLTRIQKLFPDEKIVVSMEHTGGYEANTAYFFIKLKEKFNIELLVLNPKPIKRFKEMTLHLAETDKTAAQHIALYVLKKYPDVQSSFMENTQQRAMKKLANSLEGLKKEVTRAKAQLEQLCFSVFPEIIPFMRDEKPIWLLKILDKYPVPLKLKNARFNTLMQIQNVTEAKAKKIIDLAKASRGIDNHIGFKPVVKEKVNYLLTLIQKENGMEKLLKSQFKEAYPDNSLPSIKGVSEYGASVIMSHIGDIGRFSSANKLTALFGLDPRVVESGDSAKKRKISKRGVSIVRKFLYMQCLSMLATPDHPITRHYKRLTGRGFNHYYSMVACMRKLVVIMYALLNSGEKFRMDYEDFRKAEEQSQNAITKKKKGLTNNNVASFSTDAPISKREAKKRKKLLEMKKEKSPKF